MEVKKSQSLTGKLKGLSFENGKIVDCDGVIINLEEEIYKAYKGKFFDISVSAKDEETFDTADVADDEE